MSRLNLFLPSILGLAGIVIITYGYVKWNLYRIGDNYKSISWQRQHMWRVSLTLATPVQYLFAPALEELIFRAPLVIIFSRLSTGAWWSILVSATVFALSHWFGKKVTIAEIDRQAQSDPRLPDNLEQVGEQIAIQKPEAIVTRKVIQVCLTLLVGIWSGYLGVSHQSIWICFKLHLLWNVFAPVITLLLLVFAKPLLFPLVFVVMFVKVAIEQLWHRSGSKTVPTPPKEEVEHAAS